MKKYSGRIVLLLHWMVGWLIEGLWFALVLVRDHPYWRWLQRTVYVGWQRHTCFYFEWDHRLEYVEVLQPMLSSVSHVLLHTLRYFCKYCWIRKFSKFEYLKASCGFLHETLPVQHLFQGWVLKITLNFGIGDVYFLQRFIKIHHDIAMVHAELPVGLCSI